MKKFVLTVAVVFGVILGKAQQDPQYSQFMYDRMSINPGYAGITGKYCGTLLYRNQWMGFQGSPKTVLLNADGPIAMLRGGLGLTYFNDVLGVENNNMIRLNYSYHLGIPGPGMLGLGIGLGYLSKQFNPNWNPIDNPDPQIPGLAATSGNLSGGIFDMALGAYYHHPEYYAGISVTHLTGGTVQQLNLKAVQHIYVQAGYKYDLMQDLQLQPHVRVETDAKSTQFDINVSALYKSQIWGGISYRHGDAIAPMVGYMMQLTPKEGDPRGTHFSWLTAGIAYDVTTSALRNYSSGTLELFVRYCFKPNPDQPIIKPIDVRFLGT